MATRGFTVFQDVSASSEASTSIRKVARAPSGVLGVRSGSQVNVTSIADIKTVVDKENFNPLTGERSNLATGAEKKRKTAVLATKLHVAPSDGKKEKKEKAPETKKRKTSTSTTTKKTKSTTSKKDGKSGTTKKSKRSTPSRRVTPLPKVDEETGAEVGGQHPDPQQAVIDSRCYELTVKPLADVSDAYEASSSSIEISTGSKGLFRMIKEPSLEPELRDYFSPTHSSSFGSSQFGVFNDSEETTPSHVFSTPERQKIYAAFTFSSPSPSSKRFRELGTRTVSPTPFVIELPPSPVASAPADPSS